MHEILKGIILPVTKRKGHKITSKITNKFTAYAGIICDNKTIKEEGLQFWIGKGWWRSHSKEKELLYMSKFLFHKPNNNHTYTHTMWRTALKKETEKRSM